VKHYSRESNVHPEQNPYYHSNITILDNEVPGTAGGDFEDDANAVLFQTLSREPL